MYRIFIAALTVASAASAAAQTPSELVPFKKTDKGDLQLHVFKPSDWRAGDKRPAIVFFFGGGWVRGNPKQFYPHCDHLAKRGMVAISAQYRIRKSHGTDPYACVEDGKSAVRWIRANASKLGVDPDKIAAGGGSAGGHVGACTGVIKGFDHPDEDASVSSAPIALVLFNPVIDTSKKGWGNKAAGERWEQISPSHNVGKHVPPTIIFQGDADTTTPPANAQNFQKQAKALGIRCDLHSYEGRKHGFFNKGRGDGKDYDDTVAKMDAFLVSLGLLEKKG